MNKIAAILKELEAESIEIFRETAASFKKPVIMYSIGKDSTVMLHIARKAFYPAPIPFPLLHIDTTWQFKEMITFRDEIVKETNSETILDIASGTGDLAINLAETNATKIVGLDISSGMLEVGKEKIKKKALETKIDMILADSENMPFVNNSFDAITVAFGVRNFETLENGLKEIYRVLKPNGTFVILETSIPTKTPYKQGYKFYSKNILPVIGKLFSKDRSAYKYLSESASVFPYGEDLNNILRKIGFINVEDFPQTFGVATIYKSSK